MNTVSVIVCCYNGEQHIKQCFQCLLEQSYKNLEILFVDDGSTDNSYNEALKYKKIFINNGSVLKCFQQENKGAGGAAALALYHSTGKYICCYDIDDILYPKSIEKRANFLDLHEEYSIVRTNGYKVNYANNAKTLFVTSKVEKQKSDIFLDILLDQTNNWSGSYMVRATELWKVYRDRKMIESRFGQNLQILLVSAYKNKSAFIDEPLMEYVYNPTSFTHVGKGVEFHLNNYEGFQQIKLSILQKLEVTDTTILKLLNINHYRKCLDLSINYGSIKTFEIYYKKYSILAKPEYIYCYYHYKYNKNFIKSSYYRALNFIKSRCLFCIKKHK